MEKGFIGNMVRGFAISILFVLIFISPVSAQTSSAQAGNLAPGAYLQFGAYDGQPLLWQVIHNDSAGSIVFSEKILTLKAFDAKGDAAEGRDSQYGTRVSEGSNYWPASNLREWLNSEAPAVRYSHQKPDAAHVLSHPFDTEPGFLNGFTANELAWILPVRHNVLLSAFDLAVKEGGSSQGASIGAAGIAELNLSGDAQAYCQWVTDRVFLLSRKELKEWVYDNGLKVDGAWSKALIAREGDLFPNPYWLRTPDMNFASTVAYVQGSRVSDGMNAYRPAGVRPALCLKAGLTLNGEGTRGNPYVIGAGSPSAGTGADSGPHVAQNNPAVNTGAAHESVPSQWAAPEIEAARNYGLTTEKVLSEYQKPITREEFCELAVKLYEALSGQKARPAPADTFSDTGSQEILKAYQLGIVTGVGNSQFAPGQLVTREQIAVMFKRTMAAAVPKLQPAAASATVFADGSLISGWAREAVADMSARGIISGVGENRFAPQGSATREQAIALVKRVYEYMEGTAIRIVEPAAKDFLLDTEGPVYLSVNETKRISATIAGDNLSFDEMYPRWGTSDVSILQVSGDVISGYSNTFAGVTERFIVTADQGVTIKGLMPGEATLKVSIGPYTDNKAQLKKIKVIVR